MPATETISPGPASGDLDALEAREAVELHDLARARSCRPRARPRPACSAASRPALHAADREAADVVVVVEVGDQQLQSARSSGGGRRRDVAEDRLEQRLAGLARLLERGATPGPGGRRRRAPGTRAASRPRRGRCRASRPGRAPPWARASWRSILLITSTVFRPMRQRLAEHEARLGQGALGGVHQQEHAVDQAQAALDLAAEVGVARGVDDVDLVALVR